MEYNLRHGNCDLTRAGTKWPKKRVFVFSNLDLWLYHQTSDWEVVKHVLQSVAVTFLFLATGMAMEKWRKP